MALKLTRLDPGEYRTEVNGREVEIFQSSLDRSWTALWIGTKPGQSPLAQGRTKREVVSRLEIIARSTKDRTKSDSHKIARRSQLTPGTEVSLVAGAVRGARGRFRFIGYTRTHDGAEWLDLVDSRGRSRAVDPAKIKQVHRDRKMVV